MNVQTMVTLKSVNKKLTGREVGEKVQFHPVDAREQLQLSDGGGWTMADKEDKFNVDLANKSSDEDEEDATNTAGNASGASVAGAGARSGAGSGKTS